MASIAELVQREKSDTQSLNQSLTHPAYLMPREPKRLHFGTATNTVTMQPTCGRKTAVGVETRCGPDDSDDDDICRPCTVATFDGIRGRL